MSIVYHFNSPYCFFRVILFFLLFLTQELSTAQERKPYLLEKYVFNGSCDDTTGNMTGCHRATFRVYSDSTYTIKLKQCRYGSPKKEWRERNKWLAYGTWIIVNGKQKLLYHGEELDYLTKFDDYVMLNGRVLKKRRRIHFSNRS